MRISDWSSDVCSSDLSAAVAASVAAGLASVASGLAAASTASGLASVAAGFSATPSSLADARLAGAFFAGARRAGLSPSAYAESYSRMLVTYGAVALPASTRSGGAEAINGTALRGPVLVWIGES